MAGVQILMDLFPRSLAAIMLIILSPLFLLISFISIVSQGYPVIFKQERVGFNYLPFRFYKFRTMVNNNSEDKITSSKDTRITVWGRLLRSSKLDELPQLWNIVKGDINFVGYRAEVPEIFNLFPQYFSFLSMSKPGLTDISSIIFKNESQLIDSDNPIKFYTSSILPIKSNLTRLFLEKDSFFLRFFIIAFTGISILNHKIALRLVNFLLPDNEQELRLSINNLLKVDFF
jgi:lipopolysaccharide/colanic/teichoic acid biosynthesis glycosyltransferase